MMRLSHLRWPLAFVLASLISLAMAEALRPTVSLAQRNPKIVLKEQIPARFGIWSEVDYLPPVLPDPTLQSRLDALYTQVLARTYRSQDGRVVMLSIAYGSDQSSEATAVHRPEFCYTAQGFVVGNSGVARLQLPGNHEITVQRLVAQQGTRTEPISYWVTLDDRAVLPGLQRKLTQLRFGLNGQIADGMLLRVSTLESAVTPARGFATQQAFLQDLFAAVDPVMRARYFGRQ